MRAVNSEMTLPDLEFADELTLGGALAGRRAMA